MCGRFDFHGDAADINALIDVLGDMDADARHYNLAPTQRAMAAHTHVSDGSRRLGPMRFGMTLPHGPKLVVNARAETVQQKPMFRRAFEARRCLVFANGFYEWQTQAKRKQPYYFTVPQAPVFAFAALYTVTEAHGPSFVILTTEANATVAPLHHRMPVILPQAALPLWLDAQTTTETAHGLLVPYADPMQVYPVTSQLNSPRFGDAACIERIAL